jgi:hypothetical protein
MGSHFTVIHDACVLFTAPFAGEPEKALPEMIANHALSTVCRC